MGPTARSELLQAAVTEVGYLSWRCQRGPAYGPSSQGGEKDWSSFSWKFQSN